MSKIIERSRYLKMLLDRKDNGMIKVITGLRRSGKTYLLREIYINHLISEGISRDNILYLALDKDINIRFRNPLELGDHIREFIGKSDGRKYVFIDEIQFCIPVDNPYLPPNDDNKITFYDTALGLMDECDLYITGSNSKMLSAEVLTNFRGRGDEIRVFPLSFSEYYSHVGGDKRDAWKEYLYHGGMPYILSIKDPKDKDRYLRNLFEETYLKDIVERHSVRDQSDLSITMDVIASSCSSLTNPTNIAKTFPNGSVSRNTVDTYISYFIESFIIKESKRFDIRGRKFISGQQKYYFTDLGLMNARLNFREFNTAKLIENAVFNELLSRGYNVDVGRIDVRRKGSDGEYHLVSLETDFVINHNYDRYYIQVASGIDDIGKKEQEEASLIRIKDGFGKMILVNSDVPKHRTENGILVMSILDFMLDPDVLGF